jgi:very-short-patch-repair endonuclease
MPVKKIVTGQWVAPEKYKKAVEMRRDMTPAEKLLWERLRANRLDGFHSRRQQIISGFIVDFYCHAKDLVVEIDGSVHEKQEDYDTERDRGLEDHGLRILRFTNQEVLDHIGSVLMAIRTHLSPQPPSHEGRGSAGKAPTCPPDANPHPAQSSALPSPLPFREGGTEGG